MNYRTALLTTVTPIEDNRDVHRTLPALSYEVTRFFVQCISWASPRMLSDGVHTTRLSRQPSVSQMTTVHRLGVF
jgi:hypothetical protein